MIVYVNNRIRKYRKAKGYTQQKLADLCGVSRNHIQRVENLLNMPTIKLAMLISYALDKKVSEVFYFDTKEG